jgi:ectoine hydroxylase-related dioxygenase (phytanoyl-CoA dioxygenase family)
LLAANGAIGRLVSVRLGASATPVRLVFFDKTEANNWAVAWHQDRTIAVKARSNADGFGPWSIKSGVLHASPPFAVLEQMVTVRIHLDDCGVDNAPLLIALGSHKLGSVKAQEAAALARGMPIVACLASAGDAWLYRTPILHASDPAIAPKRRRVIQVDYAAFDLPHGLAWAGL